jgi:hypothetical protein
MDNATPIRRVRPPAPRLGNDDAAGDLKRLHLTGGIAGLNQKIFVLLDRGPAPPTDMPG